MTDQGRNRRDGPRGRAALEQIDLQLEGLLGKLGDTLGEMIARLEEGETGELRRSHEVQTSKGPVRAEAGLRVRMGLGDTPGPAGSASVAQPVRPRAGSPDSGAEYSCATHLADAPTGASGATGPDQPRPLDIDAYRSDGRWILSADMPGVSLPEVSVTLEGGQVCVASDGRRRYAGRRALPAGADPSDMDIALRNGVLEITVGLAGSGRSE
jgi:hypothetical protein